MNAALTILSVMLAAGSTCCAGLSFTELLGTETDSAILINQMTLSTILFAICAGILAITAGMLWPA